MPFEGWAQDEKTALAMLEGGKLPLFLATTLMPWGRWAALLAEYADAGGGKHHRRQPRLLLQPERRHWQGDAFGATEDVQQRLRWMRDVLMPV
jgi:hypothetical protein